MARIIQLVHRYPPSQGGAESHAQRLAKTLAGRGHTVRVETTTGQTHDAFVNPRASRLPPGIETDGGVLVRRHPVWVLPGQRLALSALGLLPLPYSMAPWLFPWGPVCPGLARLHVPEEEKPDVVHAMAFPHGTIAAAGLRLARRHGARFALTPFWHPGPSGPSGDRFRRGFNHPSLVAIARQADLIIAQTKTEQAHLTGLGIALEKIAVAPPGIDPSQVTGGNRERGRQRWGLPSHGVVVGHLAPICRGKGSVALIEALNAMKGDGVHGLFAGPVLAEASKAAQSLPPHIRMVPPLDEEARRDFFATIDIFCLPSVIDSFGLVLLEAWAAGVPCVVARAGGPGDLVASDGGIVVDHPEAASIAPALIHLARDPGLRAQLGAEGSARLRKSFLAEHRYGAIAQLIEGLSSQSVRVPGEHPTIS